VEADASDLGKLLSNSTRQAEDMAYLVVDFKTVAAELCSMLRTLLVVSFLLLALVAPVWIPPPAIRISAPRATATRRVDG
jgi:hypothetical protein